MKLSWISILSAVILFLSVKAYGNKYGYWEPDCMALTKGHLHDMLESPEKSTTIGKYRLSLKTPCTTSCGQDCSVLLHGYEEARLINPVDDEFDNYGTCVYHLGANDHIHVAVQKIK
jgi:hypothetical protein